MKPDLKNEPLTVAEFLKLPAKLIAGEYWEVVREGTVHEEHTVTESWANTISSICPDNNIKIVGYIGQKTGIRLCRDCGEVLVGGSVTINAKPH